MENREAGAAMSEHPTACPACGGAVLIRSGHACGRQRWRCKGCGRQFTRTTPRGKPEAMKREAVGLYCAGRARDRGRDRRGLALRPKKARKLWIWKAFERATGRLVDRECGDRDRVTLDRLLARLEPWGV